MEHERGALEAESRALREAVQSLRGELAAVSAALDEERSHPAYGRALALEAEVRGLRQAVEGQREDLAAMAREVEAERAAGRELRNRWGGRQGQGAWGMVSGTAWVTRTRPL